MLLADYIEMLKGVLEAEGNHEVAIAQRGYYAQGQFADLYSVAEVEKREIGNLPYWKDGELHYTPEETKKFVILGESYQSY